MLQASTFHPRHTQAYSRYRSSTGFQSLRKIPRLRTSAVEAKSDLINLLRTRVLAGEAVQPQKILSELKPLYQDRSPRTHELFDHCILSKDESLGLAQASKAYRELESLASKPDMNIVSLQAYLRKLEWRLKRGVRQLREGHSNEAETASSEKKKRFLIDRVLTSFSLCLKLSSELKSKLKSVSITELSSQRKIVTLAQAVKDSSYRARLALLFHNIRLMELVRERLPIVKIKSQEDYDDLIHYLAFPTDSSESFYKQSGLWHATKLTDPDHNLFLSNYFFTALSRTLVLYAHRNPNLISSRYGTYIGIMENAVDTTESSRGRALSEDEKNKVKLFALQQYIEGKLKRKTPSSKKLWSIMRLCNRIAGKRLIQSLSSNPDQRSTTRDIEAPNSEEERLQRSALKDAAANLEPINRRIFELQIDDPDISGDDIAQTLYQEGLCDKIVCKQAISNRIIKARPLLLMHYHFSAEQIKSSPFGQLIRTAQSTKYQDSWFLNTMLNKFASIGFHKADVIELIEESPLFSKREASFLLDELGQEVQNYQRPNLENRTSAKLKLIYLGINHERV